MTPLIVIVALLLLMWMLLIRPQRRRQAEQVQMLSNLAVGDEILTAGGLYGTIERVGDDDVTVKIAPGTSVRMAKRAVAAILTEEEPAVEDEEDEEPDALEEAEEEPETAGASAETPTSAGAKPR